MEQQQELSRNAQSLWGKLAPDRSNYWLPLWLHLSDTGEIAKLLWDHWLPEHTKLDIAAGLEIDDGRSKDMQCVYAREIAVFMAASHDLGKASPVFVSKASKVGFGDIVDEITSRGLLVPTMNPAQAKDFPHALMSECILERQGLDRSFAVIIGGHHGKPPDSALAINHAEHFPSFTGIGAGAWEEVQQELLVFALNLSGLERIPQGSISVPAQVLLSGFLIMADWLASGQEYFPLLSRDYPCRVVPSGKKRAESAWAELHLPVWGEFSDGCSWAELYSKRFQRQARPMQNNALQVAVQTKDPGIFVIEAPMGEGKTEAALAVAEVMARRYGLSGVYFALPTQATSDGIFPRILEWIRALHPKDSRSVFLAHGKAGFNEDYAGIKLDSNVYDDETGAGSPWAQFSPAVTVNDWTCGRKKGLLADFVVGTIDQVLMAGLKSKHLALRHLGLANKVVILDECHAYDAYMSSYLDLVLSWLGAYHVPVIVLSATLPPYRRQKLLQAYRSAWGNKKKKSYISRKAVHNTCRTEHEDSSVDMPLDADAYPLISYTDGLEIKEDMPRSSGRKLDVRTEMLDEDVLVDRLLELLSEGGCVGIIRNTVKQAQETAVRLEKTFGTECVRLLHSQFLACDRVQKEKELRDLLGPGECQRPTKLIVVGTQVMEQSLDVDFDVLFTDICPMDLLLQRMGRLHRHARKTPRPFKLCKAVCFIMGVDGAASFAQGSTVVYGAYSLLKTKAFLPSVIHMPDDIVRLVRQAYEQGFEQEMKERLCTASSADIHRICDGALAEYNALLAAKEEKAKSFQIKRPDKQKKSLIEWLAVAVKDDASGKRGEATVRDSTNSLDVLVVVKKRDDCFYTVPWLSQYADVRIDSVADHALAKSIAGCRVSLPGYFTAKWNIDKVIKVLEQIVLDNQLVDWYSSYWLNGELFLVLDESGAMQLLDKVVIYDERYGLSIKDQEG